jgi:hypothetical protein
MRQMSDDQIQTPSGIMFLHKINRGGVICDAELACAIGALLLQRHYGSDELARQEPLTAADKGDCWRVEGAHNRDYGLEADGPYLYDNREIRWPDFRLWAVGPEDRGKKLIRIIGCIEV